MRNVAIQFNGRSPGHLTCVEWQTKLINNTNIMKRFLVIFQRHIDAGIQKREFMNIFARDMDGAIAKWNAIRTPNEWLTSITPNPTKEEAWAHLP